MPYVVRPEVLKNGANLRPCCMYTEHGGKVVFAELRCCIILSVPQAKTGPSGRVRVLPGGARQQCPNGVCPAHACIDSTIGGVFYPVLCPKHFVEILQEARAANG